MKNRTILAIVMVAIMLVGCGVDEEVTFKAPDNKEEMKVETEVIEETDTLSQEEDEGTTEETVTEVVEESTVETVPTEQVKSEEVQKSETRKTEQKKVQTKTETPTVTTPVVNAPAVTTPEPEVKVEECTHWYQAVETEEYDRIEPHYIFGCNGCGFPLFTIDQETHDAVNIPDLYFHRECYSSSREYPLPTSSYIVLLQKEVC